MNLRKFINQYIKEVTHSYEYEDMSNEDENDKEDFRIGNYHTKYFHVCPGASSLYMDIESKGVDMDMAERSARLHDVLFFVEEHIQRDGYKPEKDYIMVAKNLQKNIMKMAKMMGLEKEHHYIQGHVDIIIKTVKGKKLEERVIELTEKNTPTNPSKWSYYKSQAKKKFDVYPSAYANAWAAKQYKAAGGGWRTTKENIDEAIKGMNRKTGEMFGVVVGSDKKNKEGNFELTIRVSYSSRISAYKLTFNSNNELINFLDYGYSMDGSLPDMKGSGSGKSIRPDKKQTIKFIAKLTSPAFANKIYKHLQQVNEATFVPNSGTMSGGVLRLDNRKYQLKKDIKNVKIGNYIVTLPKGTILYNIAGGLFADHKSLEQYETRNQRYFKKSTFRGIQVTQKTDTIKDIDKSSKVLESLDERKSMDMKKRLKVYDKLKKGDKITIKYGSSMRGGVEKEFVVSKGKTLVGKQKVERIILQNPANPKGVKYYLYQRNGNVTMAIGDMAASIEDMHESVNEGISVFDERHFGKKGIIIMIDDNGKKVSAIFKNKKNADKYNRNKSSDLQALLKLAKNTPYPKAIDESVNEYYVENFIDTNEIVEYLKENSVITEAEYQGRKVELNKIMQGDVKKFKVYVKNPKGNVVKVNFGQGGDAKGGTMKIRKNNPKARASFRARHNCDNPGPKHKARYWSCRKW